MIGLFYDMDGNILLSMLLIKKKRHRIIQILLLFPPQFILQSDQQLLCNSRVAAALPTCECSTAKNCHVLNTDI